MKTRIMRRVSDRWRCQRRSDDVRVETDHSLLKKTKRKWSLEEDNRLRMFDYGVLEKEWFTGGEYLEVGRKEIMFEGATNNLPLFFVNQTIRALGADPNIREKQ